MSRPNIDADLLVTAMEGWDALLKDILNALSKTPLPIPQFANLAAFPAASSYDRCMAAAIDTSKTYVSNGTVWKEVVYA